jgi:hypothetical protein
MAVSLTNLANVYRTQNKHDLAESLYKRAIEIEEKRLGKDRPSVIRKREELTAYLLSMRSHTKPEITSTHLDQPGKFNSEISGRYYKTPLH